MSGYSDSAEITAGLDLQGVWIHDPLDPEGTSTQFLYGRSSRSDQVDALGSSQFYAGRQFPVTDYGEHEQDTWSVTLVVPHGPDWGTQISVIRDFAQAKRTLCVRDNRGRVYFGTISGFGRDDQHIGTTVSFDVQRVDYDQDVA